VGFEVEEKVLRGQRVVGSRAAALGQQLPHRSEAKLLLSAILKPMLKPA
jgi:hypothetical protein